jgi:hypothetical protein
MADDEVGYGKPPKHSRFKSGVSGNPSGRPRREAGTFGEIIQNAVDAPIQYREQGRVKTITRNELGLRKLVEQAVKGNLAAAEQVLKVRAQALRDGEAGIERLEISDWLPDYPGQTAEQKTRDFLDDRDADPQQWWQQDSAQPTKTD